MAHYLGKCLSRFDVVALISLLAFLNSSGCAFRDWTAYNFASPPAVEVIPKEKLALQWKRGAADVGKNNALAASLEDEDWGIAFESVANKLYGWQPDFCKMYSRRDASPSFVARDIEPYLKLADTAGIQVTGEARLKTAFWQSYLRNVYYDVIFETPSIGGEVAEAGGVETNKDIRQMLRNLIARQEKFVEQVSSPSVARGGFFKRTQARLNEKNGAERELLIATKDVGTSQPPECPAAIGNIGSDESVVSRSFLGRFLIMIDKDHEELLVDLNDSDNSEVADLRERIAAWKMERLSCCRALTVSKDSPASLSQSVKRPDPDPSSEKQPFFLRASNNGQKALVHLAEEMWKKACSTGVKPDECDSEKLKGLEGLLELLEKEAPSPAIKSFGTMQKLELTTSSAVNSPDPSSRLEYVTSYTYFYPYPYPSNRGIVLEDEFWTRFRAYQIGKSSAERSRALVADLDKVWQDMMVRIENVETTVQQTPIDIAQISREATQSIEIAPQPSVELKGTVKGTVETPVDLSSSMKTTVTEKLLKELDRRSTWLNTERNLLRITQRGMEAANIAGSFKEKVTLRVPPAIISIPYLEFVDGTIKVRVTNQPLYAAVPALSISLGVVREPNKLKRSATEKFGLADSSDARYIVVVSEPARLNLWQWDRTLNVLTTDHLSPTMDPVQSDDRRGRLAFSFPETGTEGLFVLATGQEKFLRSLRNGMHRLIHPSPPNDDSLNVSCRWKTGTNDKFYFVINVGASPLGKLWVGKQGLDGQMVPLDGSETSFLGEVKAKGRCG